MAQRQANERAAVRGEPLPFPNPWDVLDPTKVGPDAKPEQITASFREFSKRCRTQVRRRIVL